MSLAGHVAQMETRGMQMSYWWESQKVRHCWEDLEIGGWIILELILESKKMGQHGLDWSASGCGPVEGSFECGNEPECSLECCEVLQYMHN
jgi:hypothetical protein